MAKRYESKLTAKVLTRRWRGEDFTEAWVVMDGLNVFHVQEDTSTVADRLPVWTDAVRQSQNGRPTAKQLDEIVTARLTLGSVPQETPPLRRLGRQTRPEQLPLSTVLHHPPTPFRPFRVSFERPGDVHFVADQAIRKVRELVELLGTPDSAVAAGAGEALEKLERCKDQLAQRPR